MQTDKSEILTQMTAQQERKFKLRWLVALSSLPLFGMVAAFGLAPQTDTTNTPIHSVVENLVLPTALQTDTVMAVYSREEPIQRGDTLASLLSRLNVNDPDALRFLKTHKEAASLYQLKPGKTVQARTTEEGDLISMRYISSDGKLLQIEKQGNEFKAVERDAHLEQRVLMKSGSVRSSLFAATDAVNLPDSVATQMAEIFSTDIDFHQDLRKGDKFTVVYETFYNQGELVKVGRLLAAEFINNGKPYRAVYFQDPKGQGDYYTPEGKNLRKAFLRSPLEFSRISSGFTTSRFHPVLQTLRAHKGIDFAAPTGTRIRATADGTVVTAGAERGYGNFILLQHHGKFSTAYGHLSAFAKGLRRGSKVKQGEVIGYVGMTGLATGPHLHYEFRIADVQHNPLSMDIPTSFPILAQYKTLFTVATKSLLGRLELLRGTNLAFLE